MAAEDFNTKDQTLEESDNSSIKVVKKHKDSKKIKKKKDKKHKKKKVESDSDSDDGSVLNTATQNYYTETFRNFTVTIVVPASIIDNA